ncbi:MAG TPA: hypothetical protein VGI43_11445 [Mucilaginibacter sp.]|jgi:hypothetical protein
MATNKTLIFKLKVTAIILVAAGYGWAGGHFIPQDSQLFVYFFQFIILLILLILSIGFFNPQVVGGQVRPHSRWGIIGLNVFTAITLVINIANIIHGFNNTGHDAFGSHNTLADLVPMGIIMIGDIVWLVGTPAVARD